MEKVRYDAKSENRKTMFTWLNFNTFSFGGAGEERVLLAFATLYGMWTSGKGRSAGDWRLLILTIVMLTMNGGARGRPLFSPPAFGFTNEQRELRGKKCFCVISESLSDLCFFFFFLLRS